MTPAEVIWGLNGLTSSTIVFGATAATHKMTWTNNINFNGAERTFFVNNGAAELDLELPGVLSGTGASGLTKRGVGTMVLSGANTYEGGTRIIGGILRLSGPGTIGTNTGNLAIGGGALDMGGKDIIAAAVSINSSLSPVPFLNGNNVTGTSFSVTADPGDIFIPTNLLGDAATPFSKIGSSVVELSGTNTFGSGTFTYGATDLNHGAIRLASAGALGGYTGIQLVGSGNAVRQIQLAGGLTYGFNLAMEGVSNPATTGAALFSFSDENIWNGAITISGSGGYGIGSAGGSSLVLNGNLGGAIDNGDPVNFHFHGDGNITVNGVISDATGTTPTPVGLVKSGFGELTLTAANTFTHETSVTGGFLTLTAQGALGQTPSIRLAPSTVFDVSALASWTLGEMQSLSGSGYIVGGILAQGTVSPGPATGTPGILEFQNDLSLTATSTYKVDIDISESGTTNDILEVGGTLNINGSINVTLSGTQAPTLGSEFDIANATSITGTPTVTGALPAGLAWDATDFAVSGKIKIVQGEGSPFQLWATSKNLTGDAALPGADPDRDGANNLLEFALNGDPNNGSDNGLSTTLLQDASAPAGKELTLVIAVRDGANFSAGTNGVQTATIDGVVYTVEGSLDLIFPSSAVNQVGAASDIATGLPSLSGTDWEYRTFKLNASEGLAGKGFLRLQVREE